MGSSDPVNISEKLFCLLFQKNIPRNATDAIMTAITAIIQSGTRAHKTAIIIVDIIICFFIILTRAIFSFKMDYFAYNFWLHTLPYFVGCFFFIRRGLK